MQRLEKNDDRTRAVLASLQSHIAVIDRDGWIVDTNPAWEDFTRENGGSPDRCGVGTNYLDVCKIVRNDQTGEDTTSFLRELRELLDGKIEQLSLEYPCHSPTKMRWFILKATRLKSENGGAVVSHQDITDRKLAELALRNQEERIRTILSTASDAIITINNRGIIDSANAATERMFGYSLSELIGQNVSILMPLPYRTQHDGYIQRFLKTGEAHIMGVGREVLCLRRDGSTFPADLAVSQVDHLGLFTGVLRDMSSHKKMQKHLLEIATEEQRRIGLELHDGIQQEMTGLTLYVNAMIETIHRAKCLEANGGSLWQFNEASYERILNTALLIAKRLTEANMHVRDMSHGIMPVQIDAEGLRSALGELANTIEAKGDVHCHFEYVGKFNILDNSTATHLFRIAQEATNNALRHGSASEIHLSLARYEDRITLEIIDNGHGFAPKVLSEYRVGSEGMGLRTMEYRAGLIGGVIQIENKPEGGTMVRCTVLRGGDYSG